MRPDRIRLLLSLCLFASLAGATRAADAQPARTGHLVSSLEIKILSTMLADEGFGEWGFAALVEVDGRRILFDTGAKNRGVDLPPSAHPLVPL